ncbi:MAG TPA: hypothetical protein PLN96_17610, partial [Zoogloea sp.]|uniref:hypothetical protein n=1 Tax=Zoogloea sp. TaxID=49181 RepID=UPI002BAC9608
GSNVMVAPLFYHPDTGDTAQSSANAQNICDTRQAIYAMNGWGLYAATTTLTDISLIRAASSSPCGTDVLAGTATLTDFRLAPGRRSPARNPQVCMQPQAGRKTTSASVPPPGHARR